MFSLSCVAVTPQFTLCGKPTSVLDGQRFYCPDDHRRTKRNDIAFQQRVAKWRKNSPEVLVAKRAYDSALEAVRAARRTGTSALQKTVNDAARNYLKAVELSRERQYPGILEAERAAREEERRKRKAEHKAAQEAEKERLEEEKAQENQKYYAEYLDSYKQTLRTMKSERDDELEFIHYRSEAKIREVTENYENSRRFWLKEYREWLQYSLFDEPRHEEGDMFALASTPDDEDSQKERNEAFAAQMATYVAMRAVEEEDAAMTDEARVAAAEADVESLQVPFCIASLNLLNAVQSKGMSLSRAMNSNSLWGLRHKRSATWIRLEAAKYRLRMAYERQILTRAENVPERVLYNFIELDGPIMFAHGLFPMEDMVFDIHAPVFARDPEGSIDLRAFAADSQNVHRSGTISAIEAAIHRLCEIPCVNQNTLTEIFELFDTSAPALRAVIADDYNLVHAFNYSYANVLNHVWDVMRSHEHRGALETRFIEEVRDGEDVCHTGKMTRLVNVLAGFHDAVGDLMPPMELFRNRFALLSQKPLEEREDAAKELFREFAITEDEQLAWLEPLLEA